jgi:flagellar motor switch protein FliG
MEATPVYLPLRFNQILDIVKQLPKPEKQKLIAFLLKQSPDEEALTLTHFASEQALAKDWLTQTEDLAWQDL